MTRTLTRTIFVDGDECSLEGLTEALDDRIDEACSEIEERGGMIIGPVSIAPARGRYTEYVEDSHRDRNVVEEGVLATITYRIDLEAEDATPATV